MIIYVWYGNFKLIFILNKEIFRSKKKKYIIYFLSFSFNLTKERFCKYYALIMSYLLCTLVMLRYKYSIILCKKHEAVEARFSIFTKFFLLFTLTI